MITPDTPILSPPRATADQCSRYIRARPHGEYTDYDIASVIVPSYFDVCGLVDVDPLLAIAQMVHETGNLSSPWSARPHRNPAGIGVTGQPGAGVSFPTWADDAIPAHVGRLLAYATPADRGTLIQQALIAKALSYRPLPASYRGAAPTLAGLAGRWAVPGTDYPSKIAQIANAMIGAQGVNHLASLDILDLSAEIAALPRQRGHETLPARDAAEHSVTLHYSGVVYTDRSRAAELAQVLDEARYQLGKNWGKAGKPPIYGDRYMYDFGILSDGQIVRYNRERIQLWHAGNAEANAHSWSIHWMLGSDQALTAPQRASTIALLDALRADGGIDRQAVYGHCEWPRGKGAPQPSATYRLLPSQSECPGKLLHQFVVDYRAGRA
jgi:N-acetylmuramoyl-L-alanine amidase